MEPEKVLRFARLTRFDPSSDCRRGILRASRTDGRFMDDGNPMTKPDAARLRAFADDLDREGDSETAALVRRAADALDREQASDRADDAQD